jgi:hypothetical protein
MRLDDQRIFLLLPKKRAYLLLVLHRQRNFGMLFEVVELERGIDSKDHRCGCRQWAAPYVFHNYIPQIYATKSNI